MISFLLGLLNDDRDRQLFEQIYLSYRKQMFFVARSFLHSDTDAEDAVHDVFLRIASSCWDSVSRIQNETDLRNYLLKAVKNRALSILERQKKNNLPLEEDAPEQDPAGYAEDETFEKVCRNMGEARLLQSIELLPELYRDVLYYRYVLQFSVPETAQSMEQSVFATKKQIQRGKQKLLELLGE